MFARATPALPLSLATFGAAIAGVTNAAAFPGLGWWPLVFVGTPLLLVCLVGRRFWGACLVGLIGGFAFWGSHIFWLTVYLGLVPWLALAGLQSVFFALGCAIIALAWRFSRGSRSATMRYGVTPAAIAGLWLLRETITSNWPYGGFSWGRLAFSQSEGPFAHLVAWVGISGLSFLIVWVSALIVQVVRSVAGESGVRSAGEQALSSRARRGIRNLLPVALLAAMAFLPVFAVATSGTARIAAVQGNADAGLFAKYVPGQILQDHLAATAPLFGQKVDLVVWPENSADLNPLLSGYSRSALDTVSSKLSAPVIAGTITAKGDQTFNSLLLWQAGAGAIAQYDKIHPVPFAEYVPDRAFWYPLAPDLLSLVPRDYTIGTRPNVFDLGAIRAGVAICFDIVDDNLIRQMVAGGANIIVAPTNNADFGHTDESVQQLAIVRLRAIESGRSVVNASTVGTSAIIDPSGKTVAQLPTFKAGTMVEDVPLSTTTTPATAIGLPLELTLCAFALAWLIVAAFAARRQENHRG
ncbi:MAG: apolipoprotein N-acyltransferase [Microbacteriaceae bacterium]|nr:apolipoprotein N-acyltransferase [Microbacteriaceae bacterium]